MKTLAVTSMFVAGLTTASVLHAQSGGSMMGSGMMNQGGMMNMMHQMGEMMENCNKMMQSMHHDRSGKPHEQKREGVPTENTPQKKG